MYAIYANIHGKFLLQEDKFPSISEAERWGVEQFGTGETKLLKYEIGDEVPIELDENEKH